MSCGVVATSHHPEVLSTKSLQLTYVPLAFTETRSACQWQGWKDTKAEDYCTGHRAKLRACDQRVCTRCSAKHMSIIISTEATMGNIRGKLNNTGRHRSDIRQRWSTWPKAAGRRHRGGPVFYGCCGKGNKKRLSATGDSAACVYIPN